MKKTILTITIALVASGVMLSQSAVNVSGGSQVIDSNTFDYSVGEMAVIYTAQSANITVTHGVLQPKEGTLSVQDNPLDFALTVYPNPASDIINLQPALSGGGTLDFTMTDMNGRTILRQTATLHTGTEKQQFDISHFASGTYLLYTTFTQNGKPHTKTFKVIKH